jgi:phosphatidate cytidylyltransferase
MLAKRLISSIILWAALLGVLFYLPTWASALLCVVFSTTALWEFFCILEKGNHPCSKRLGLLGGIVLSTGMWWFSVRDLPFTATFEVLFFIAFVIVLFSKQLFRPQDTDTIEKVGNTLLGVIYVSWLFNFIPKIKFLFATGPISPLGFFGVNPQDQGPGWLLVFYLVLVTKFCDSGAYGFGRLFGKHQMAPHISPKKTWEGFAGGLFTAVLASVLGFLYLEARVSKVGFQIQDALILGLLLGVLAVVGDLVESLIKRKAQVKDSGEMLPGIGGALDLVDSLLFTGPVLYAYLILVVK